MNYAIIVPVAVFVIVYAICMYFAYQKKGLMLQPKPKPLPSIARINYHKLICPFCKSPFEEDDLSISYPHDGTLCHLICVAIITSKDGSVYSRYPKNSYSIEMTKEYWDQLQIE